MNSTYSQSTIHSAYSESDRRTGASPKPPCSRGLKFAKRGSISGDFRPFSTVFRQIGAQNYFRFRFSLQLQIKRRRLYGKRRTYRHRILANFWDTGSKSPIFGRFCCFSPKWRLKLLPFPVFTSDSNSSPSTLLETAYISINKRSKIFISAYIFCRPIFIIAQPRQVWGQYLRIGDGWPHEVSSTYWRH